MLQGTRRFKICAILAVSLAALLAYMLLLADHGVFSINSIIIFSQHMELPAHILVLGLLPIYISLMLGTAAIIGIFLSRKIVSLFSRKSA